MQETIKKRVPLSKRIQIPGQGELKAANTPSRPRPSHGGRRQNPAPGRVKKLNLKDIRDNQRKLIKYWPQLFRNGRILPLKAGIKEAMLADLEARGVVINPKRIASELFSATNTENYCRRMLFLKWRFDLNGKPAVKITEAERDFAYSKLARRMTERGRTPPKEGFWKIQKPRFRRREVKKDPA
ncbi:ProQ/FINO family protein [Pantoea septica]|uniref:ProQ/FINO family protein n=1 Tax=Pantoea septica TaxID=472695 RepID=UPI0023F90E94|nr:ProQ/FINO family protein [Pantoea septica]